MARVVAAVRDPGPAGRGSRDSSACGRPEIEAAATDCPRDRAGRGRPQRRVLAARRGRPAVRAPEARREPRRADRPSGRHEPMDHRGCGPPRRAALAGTGRRPPHRRAARCSPTTPASPSAPRSSTARTPARGRKPRRTRSAFSGWRSTPGSGRHPAPRSSPPPPRCSSRPVARRRREALRASHLRAAGAEVVATGNAGSGPGGAGPDRADLPRPPAASWRTGDQRGDRRVRADARRQPSSRAASSTSSSSTSPRPCSEAGRVRSPTSPRRSTWPRAPRSGCVEADPVGGDVRVRATVGEKAWGRSEISENGVGAGWQPIPKGSL